MPDLRLHHPHPDVGALAGPRVSAALAGADWLVPDGVGVVLAMAHDARDDSSVYADIIARR
jgi:hypothetical protein